MRLKHHSKTMKRMKEASYALPVTERNTPEIHECSKMCNLDRCDEITLKV